jgi:hypothetical protein
VNDLQNMNMEEKFNYIETSLTQYLSFKILHEKIEQGVFELRKAGFGWDFLYRGLIFAFFWQNDI